MPEQIINVSIGNQFGRTSYFFAWQGTLLAELIFPDGGVFVIKWRTGMDIRGDGFWTLLQSLISPQDGRTSMALVSCVMFGTAWGGGDEHVCLPYYLQGSGTVLLSTFSRINQIVDSFCLNYWAQIVSMKVVFHGPHDQILASFEFDKGTKLVGFTFPIATADPKAVLPILFGVIYNRTMPVNEAGSSLQISSELARCLSEAVVAKATIHMKHRLS